MKTKFSKILSCSLLLMAFYCSRAQQAEVVQPLKQVFDITMDDKGNAAVEVSMKLNASQWDNFKKTIGTNTSIIKREMEKALPKYFLSDFDYSENGMERSYKVKFNVLGMGTLNKGGKWEAQLESKDPDITKLSDREFVLNQTMTTNGLLINQTQKLHLPSNANGAKVEKDSFGKAMMTYTTSMGLVPRLITYGGVLMMLAGAWLFYRNQNKPGNKLTVVKEAAAA
jgi:hypothetical protein